MAEPKTRPTDASVEAFLAKIPDANVRADAQRIDAIMRETTGSPPVMWGTAIIGYGSCQLTYASGRELDWPIAAFSPRKTNLTVYLAPGLSAYGSLLAKLGKHSIGKVCLYIKKLADVDVEVLTELIEASTEYTRAKYPTSEPAPAAAAAKKKPAAKKKKAAKKKSR